MRGLALALAALLWSACATTVDVASEPVALDWMERWSAQEQGYDTMAAYEIAGPEDVQFAIARRWDDESVRVLIYQVGEISNGFAGVFRRQPGWKGDTRTHSPAARRVFVGSLPVQGSLRTFSLFTVGSQVAIPILIEDWGHRLVGEETFGAEEAVIVESLPRRSFRTLTSMRSWISKRTLIAMRRVYYRNGEELGRMEVAREDVEQVGMRYRTSRRTIRTGDGVTSQIVLHNELPDVVVPEELFSDRTLLSGRYPKF